MWERAEHADNDAEAGKRGCELDGSVDGANKKAKAAIQDAIGDACGSEKQADKDGMTGEKKAKTPAGKGKAPPLGVAAVGVGGRHAAKGSPPRAWRGPRARRTPSPASSSRASTRLR